MSGRKSCCSILYSAYYCRYSPKNATVLLSTLRTSPTWLELVRQMNKDVVCGSIVWTDFALTSDAVYRDVGPDGTDTTATTAAATTAYTASDDDDTEDTDDDEEEERGRRRRTPRARRPPEAAAAVSTDEEHIPRQARRVLRRYFYDVFCNRLATEYGVPTLLTFLDRANRGLDTHEDDRNHRAFVDSMLTDVRFVAAVEITAPSDERAAETSPSAAAAAVGARTSETATAGQRSGGGPVAPVEPRRDSSFVDRDESVGDRDESAGDRDERYDRHAEDDSAFHYNSEEYEFDYDDLELLGSIDPRLMQTPKAPAATDITDSQMNLVFDEYEAELKEGGERDRGGPESQRDAGPTGAGESSRMLFYEDLDGGEPNGGAAVASPALADAAKPFRQLNVGAETTEATGVVEAAAFKLPSRAPAEKRKHRDGQTESRKRRSRAASRDRSSKENADTGESEDDVRSSDGSGGGRRRSELGESRERLDLADVELLEGDGRLIRPADLPADTLVFVYALKRITARIVRFVRVHAAAAADSSPPIDPDGVIWDADKLLHGLRALFGDGVSWLGARAANTREFQIRDVSAELAFGDGAPNLFVSLERRPKSFFATRPVRV